MDEMLASSALWAMHPLALDAMLKRDRFDAMLPDAVRKLGMMGAPSEAKAADPIREGATAIVPIRGLIAPKSVYRSAETDSELLASRMGELAADPKVGAIILDIKSPGGLVWGTREAGDAIYAARQSKPVIALANPFAFSAAYWLASQATRFYAAPSADVGSVGVRSGHTDMSGFEEKIGMRTTLIASSPDKIAGHPYAPLADEDRAEIQSSVDESNVQFVAAIARGRGLAAGEVPAVHGSGKTFSAARALANGAIDGIATLPELVAKYGSSRSRLGLMRRQASVRGMAAGI